MVRLRVLGGVDLRDAGGLDLDVVLAQSKRFALLSYLAIARPRRFHSREVLLSLFWPQSDRKTGRNSLRQALHFLRHALGEGVIVSRGENDVGVDHDLLWCDAVAFETSLDGDTDGAMALYRGDLMPGALIADAPDFNRWLDVEREHLRHRVESALEHRASEAERRGDYDLALQARRRSSALEPLSARAALALMHTLANAGNRAAAIQHATLFTRALHDELGVEGDDGVTSFAAELRGDPRSLRVDVPRDPPTRATTDTPVSMQASAVRAVVLPFAVHGDPAYHYLAQGMVDLLGRSLDGGALRVVDPYAVIGFTSRSGPSPADPDLGNQVAQRFGAQLFVLGSVVGAHGRLQVFATLYHVDRGRLVTAEATVGNEAALFEIVEDLSRQLLIGRLSPAQRLTRIAATLTPSIMALKAYLTGENFYRRGCFVPAREALERALAEDGSFALAWYRLGHVVLWLQNPELALQCTQRAVAVSERLHSHDRALLEAFIAMLQGHANEAERRYRETLSTHPDNVEASLGLGLLLIAFNPLRGRPSAESLLPLARVLETDPDNTAAGMHTAYILAKEGRYAEHRSSVTQWEEKNDFAIYPRAMHALLQGTREEGDAVIGELAQADDVVLNEAVRYVARLTYNLPGAQRIARLMIDPSRSRATNALGHILFAQLAVGLGRHREALAAVGEASRFDPGSARQHGGLIAALPFIPVSNSEIDEVRGALQAPAVTDCVLPEQSPFTAPHEGLHEPIRLYVLGHLQARVEAFDLALATAEQLAALAVTPMASPLVDDWSLGVRAHVAWRQGLPRQALALLERTLLQISYTQRLAPSPFLSQNFERYLRAHLLEMVDREEDALRWYECVTSDFVHEIVFLAPSYLRRAEIHDRRGDYAQARDFYQRFIALWSGGEPEEAAVVARAQQRLIRLGGHVVREPHLAARAE